MFRKQRISLLMIVLGLLIAIGTGLKAHWYHAASSIDLSFTSNPTISCSIDGYTFTHTRQTYSDGVIYEDGWWRNPQDPQVEMTAEAHGAGWAHVLFYGNIDGTKFGDDTNTTSKQLGTWVGFAPFGGGLDHTIRATHTGSFNRSPKTYSWNLSGSIKLVPWYWKWRLSGNRGLGGSWEAAPSEHHNTQPASTSGSWTVSRNWTTLSRSSPGSSSQGSGPGCANVSGPNYCNDKGACTTRSPSGVPGECGHNYCCCAPAGSPMYGSNTGSSNTDGSSSSGGSNTGSSDSGNSGNSGDSGNTGSTPPARPTCAAGHSYNPDSTYAVNYHRTRTCRRSGCSNSWQACVTGWTAPRCSARPGSGCWAQ